MVAYIIDLIVLLIAKSVLFLPLFGLFGIGVFSTEWIESFREYSYTARQSREEAAAAFLIFIAMFILLILGSVLINWLYYALMESSRQQATLGKMAMNIKVTDIDGKRISFGRATGRHFAKFISDIIINIGYIFAAFTDKKQALHDLITDCLVINNDVPFATSKEKLEVNTPE